jgi:hypothetical protein
MKKLLALTFAFAALLVLVGCESSTAPDQPTVTYTVISNGDGLDLSWDADANADGFIIYHDGVAVDTVVGTSYTDTDPCKVVGVTAYAGSEESAADEIDCTPATTTSLTIYGLGDADTTHFSGLYFNATSGTALTASAKAANAPTIEYVFDDLNYATMTLVNSGYIWPTNNKVNTSGADGTDFDAVTKCLLTGYSEVTTLGINSVYDLWISNSQTWTDTDHYGKVKIEGITGHVATITVAYQLIGGLRWIVTP